MHKLILIFFLISSCLCAQDKIFFRNGSSKKGTIVTIAKDFVYFKTSDTSSIEKIKKSSVILMEDYKGNRYLFSSNDTPSDSVKFSKKHDIVPLNILSVQPLAIFFGRVNFSYERLSKDSKFGVVIPLILTFDPTFGNIFTADSNFVSKHERGLNFISGIDVNCYFGRSESFKLFMGPRIRFGTDMAFFKTEGYSVQTQIGFKLGRPQGKVVQHLSLGFGFVRILSSMGLVSDPKQAHMWYSLNYRFGIKW